MLRNLVQLRFPESATYYEAFTQTPLRNVSYAYTKKMPSAVTTTVTVNYTATSSKEIMAVLTVGKSETATMVQGLFLFPMWVWGVHLFYMNWFFISVFIVFLIAVIYIYVNTIRDYTTYYHNMSILFAVAGLYNISLFLYTALWTHMEVERGDPVLVWSLVISFHNFVFALFFLFMSQKYRVLSICIGALSTLILGAGYYAPAILSIIYIFIS